MATTPPNHAVDVSTESIHWDLSRSLSYGEYLDLPRLLGSQHVRSGKHDELLFISVHQSAEIWMKLNLHELHAAKHHLTQDDVGTALKMLSRAVHVQGHLAHSWDVLSTLTPADYSSFRDALGTGSGFQSYQYRELEFLLGNKNAALIAVHQHDPAIYDRLRQVLAEPSLYDTVLQLLHRRGLPVQEAYLARDWSAPYEPSPAIEQVWLSVYRDTARYWELYELAEKLVDMEDRFQQWRFRHMKTVERVIGFKQGTGGSSGAPYLAKALNLRFFPELWTLRTSL